MRRFRFVIFSLALGAPGLVSHGAAQTAAIRTIHNFTGFTGDGSFPETGVVIGRGGTLYGATLSGGNLLTGCPRDGCGTVFQMTPPAAAGQPWTETVIYSFSGPDGRGPATGLVIGSQGELYGATNAGGSYGQGTIFRLQPPVTTGSGWTLTTLYSFAAAASGVAPLSLMMGGDGVLYGTARGGGGNPACGFDGCGVVYGLSSPTAGGTGWNYRVLYRFTGQNGDGINPLGGLVYGPRGVLYGSTAEGGTGSCSYMNIPGCGTIYQIQPPSAPGGAWTETVLYSFGGPGNGDGQLPNSLALGASGALYGTTQFGGSVAACGEYCGTVFALAPPSGGPGARWAETILYSFQGTTDGGWPQAGVTIGRDGGLLGTTGFYYDGNAFELQRPAARGGPWTFVLLGSFVPYQGSGAVPSGPLALDPNGMVYGTTSEWNLYKGFGTVYRLAR
jgi:uncharacterized repeat protein (TIGR03803 family)